MQQGRDALIAGLRTPPGVLPGGSSFAPPIEGDQYAPVVYAPNDEYRLMTAHDGYALSKPHTPEFPWSSKIMRPSAQAWKLGKDGKLQGLDSSGALVWSIGTSASLDTDKYATFLFVQDGFQIVQEQPSGNPKPVWGVTSTGTCFPNGAQCDTYTK